MCLFKDTYPCSVCLSNTPIPFHLSEVVFCCLKQHGFYAVLKKILIFFSFFFFYTKKSPSSVFNFNSITIKMMFLYQVLYKNTHYRCVVKK